MLSDKRKNSRRKGVDFNTPGVSVLFFLHPIQTIKKLISILQVCRCYVVAPNFLAVALNISILQVCRCYLKSVSKTTGLIEISILQVCRCYSGKTEEISFFIVPFQYSRCVGVIFLLLLLIIKKQISILQVCRCYPGMP